MAKRSESQDGSEPSVKAIVEDKPVFAEVQAMFPAKIKATGEVTKTKYEWSDGGDVQLVDVRDVPALLLKKVGQGSCCGNNSSGNYLFVVKE